MINNELERPLQRVVNVATALGERTVIFDRTTVGVAREAIETLAPLGTKLPFSESLVAAFDSLPDLTRTAVINEGARVVIHTDNGNVGIVRKHINPTTI